MPAHAAVSALAAPRTEGDSPAQSAEKKGGGISDLRAARNARDSQGCAAAIPLFDRIARDASGTSDGLASLYDSAVCREAIGDIAGARSRFESLSHVDAYRTRATEALARIAGRPDR
jgi:hypothetical protein